MSTIGDNNDQYVGGSGEETSNKKECTSCEQNNVDNITKDNDSMAALDNISTCANCGKEGNSGDMNICNRCKEMKYCNAACKKKHRTKHKKKCDRRAKEIYDEALFKDHPPREECPICLLPLPIDISQSRFKSCCGKFVCNGCKYAMEMSEGKDLCAFCRTPPASSDKEEIKRVKKLIDKGNGDGCLLLAGCYARGAAGMPQDWAKANELYLKAGELGCSGAYYNLGNSYRLGTGVERDEKRAMHYFELAAMGGYVPARHNLGCLEGEAGNIQRAFKHMILAARAGKEASLDYVKMGFMGAVAGDEYANTLRAYHERQKEMKSDQRDKVEAMLRAARGR